MLHCFFSTFMRLIIVELEYVELCLGKLFSSIEIAGDGTLYSAGKKFPLNGITVIPLVFILPRENECWGRTDGTRAHRIVP